MPAELVVVDQSAKENGLAVILSDLILQNMKEHPEKIRCFNRLKEDVAISAADADVRVTLCFQGGSCTIFDGIVEKPALQIEADSETIVELSHLSTRFGLPNPFNQVGRSVARKAFRGKLKIRGLLSHPVALLLLANVLSVN